MTCTGFIGLVIVSAVVLKGISWWKEEQAINAIVAQNMKLKREKPEVWLQMQQLAESRKQREQQLELEEKKLKHQQVNQAVGVGMTILRIFTR
jgi:hypothetical protein